MSTKPCEFCGKPAPQVEGRKPRKFCSNTCRQKDWQAKNKKTDAPQEGKQTPKTAPTTTKKEVREPQDIAVLSDLERQLAEIMQQTPKK